MRHTVRGGTYFRVCKPDWCDPLSTEYAKRFGGRWNPPGEFGALYLNATLEVAAANARTQHRHRAIGLFDLRPDRRPKLLTITVPRSRLCDVVTAAGVRALRLPAHFPFAIPHERCWPIARRAYKAPLHGIATRSAAECTSASWLGQEVAWFDSAPPLRQSKPAQSFARWYPDLTP